MYQLAEDACKEAASNDCQINYDTQIVLAIPDIKCKNNNSITVHVLGQVAAAKAEFGYRTGCTLELFEKQQSWFLIN
jgi:hypothetical protein